MSENMLHAEQPQSIVKVLETERTFCRLFTLEDFERLYALHSTPEVGSITIDGIQNETQALETLNHFILHQAQYGYSQWMVYEKASGEFMGRAGFEFRQIDTTIPPQMEIRYAFFPAFWGKGYATELAMACMQWAFQMVNPEMIVATADPKNFASHRILEKIGMRYVKDIPYKDVLDVFYTVTRADFHARLGQNAPE